REPTLGFEPRTFRLQEGWESLTPVHSRRQELGRSPHRRCSAPMITAISHHERHHEYSRSAKYRQSPAMPPRQLVDTANRRGVANVDVDDTFERLAHKSPSWSEYLCIGSGRLLVDGEPEVPHLTLGLASEFAAEQRASVGVPVDTLGLFRERLFPAPV